MPSATPDHVEQRILEASVRLPPGGAVTGWAACRMHGGGFFDGLGRDGRTPLPVPLIVGPERRPRPAPGISLSHDRIDAAARSGWRGLPQVRSAVDLASERSRSPAETRLRLVWLLDAGLPEPLVNWPVLDLSGRLLGITDLLDPVAGLVVEYDGADHRSGVRHAADVRREDRLRRAGLEYVTVTGRDLADTRLVVGRLLAARGRARWLPVEQRSWFLGAG